MNELVEKWSTVLEVLKVTEEDKRIKMVEYAEHFSEMENSKQLIYQEKKMSLLPLNLKILKNIDNFEITNDPSNVETHEFIVEMKESDYMDIIEGGGFDFIRGVEDYIVDTITEKLKDKNILIYSLINDISVMYEKGYDAQMVLRSRIKIND